MGFLLLFHVFVTLFLTLIVLFQKNEGGSSLFASGGSSSSMFNARGTSNVLTKATWILAFIFLADCVVMAHFASSDIKKSQNIVKEAVIDKSKEDALLAVPGTSKEKESDKVPVKTGGAVKK